MSTSPVASFSRESARVRMTSAMAIGCTRDRIHPGGDGVNLVTVGGVHPHGLDVEAPREVVGTRLTGRARDDVVAAADQLGDQSAADIPGGAGDKDAHVTSLAAHPEEASR